MFINEATEAFVNLTVNEMRLTYAFENYLLSCRQFMLSKSVVYSQGLTFPSSVLTERNDNFEKLWTELESNANKIQSKLTTLSYSLNELETRVSPDLTKLIDKAKQFVVNRNESLLTLSDEFLSNRAQTILVFIMSFFEEVDHLGRMIFEAWTKMMEPIKDFWTAILEDEDMLEYYEFTNNTRFLQNLTDVLNRCISQYSSARSNLDVRIGIEVEDVEFVLAFEKVTDYLRSFKDSITVGSAFVRENILQLDIFYRQLSYEHITQQSAYDIFALICDNGGSMGLFIGASMLTVVEIIDLFLRQTPLFALNGKRKDKQESL